MPGLPDLLRARSTRATRAIAHLPEADPALAMLALWCQTADREDATGTSGDIIHFGPEFEALALREQVGLLGHHILHIALRHEVRMQAMRQRFGTAFDAVAYNLATDAIVNECLEAAGHALPRPAVTLTGLLAEVLREDPQNALSLWDADRLYIKLSALDGTGKQRQRDYCDKTRFQPDISPEISAESDGEQAEWQGHMTRALSGPMAAGRGIGQIMCQIADLPRSETPWEQRLRRLLANAVSEVPRVSYRRPRRGWIAAEAEARQRGGPAPVFEPGQNRGTTRPRIVIAVDSSGSVDENALSLFTGEVAAIARRTGAETHLMCFDEDVYHHSVLQSGNLDAALSNLSVRRDGGTDFEKVLAQAEATNPSIIVLLTDMDGPFGPAPSCPVLWATPLADWSAPPFGQVLSLAR